MHVGHRYVARTASLRMAVAACAHPRLSVAAPTALLQRLRSREGCAKNTVSKLPACPPEARRHRAAPAPPRAARSAAAAGLSPTACSTQGLRAEQLLGLRVLDLSNDLAEIGVVDKVLKMAETGAAQPLLLVRWAAEVDGVPGEEHRIPFVPQIVPWLDAAAGVVYVEPPPGLLELGRQQRLLHELGQALEPFTLPRPQSVLQRMGLRLMPTAAQLVAAGRPDLVAAVRRAGGFLEVAQALGLRSQRKPAGFWEDEVNLDEELTLFVAAHWCKFSDPETHQNYWYNQITHGVSWEEPVLPERIEIDDEGGYILTEAEEDRVMPSRSSIFAAGRYDLHNAIMLHGGYTAASRLLDRRPAWPPSQRLRSLSRLRHELKDFVAETGLPPNRLPTASQLLSAGRGDLCQAIIKRGGFVAVARKLGWASHRRGRRQWQDPQAVAEEVRRFILGSQQPEPAASASAAGGQGADGSATKRPVGVALPPGARMPTHRQLAEAGRHDLRYALQQHGSSTIGALLGIQLDSRGAHKRQDSGASGAQPTSGQ